MPRALRLDVEQIGAWTRPSPSWSAIRAAWSSATPTYSFLHPGSSTTANSPVAARRRNVTRGWPGSPTARARSLVGSRPRTALLRVRSTESGRAIEIEDVTRGCGRVRVVSHEVSSYVQTDDMFVGHLMPGPPAASLWGPMAMLDRATGRELIDLLEKRIALLGLDPHGDTVLGDARQSAALEVTRMLMPALRGWSRRSWRRRRRAA